MHCRLPRVDPTDSRLGGTNMAGIPPVNQHRFYQSVDASSSSAQSPHVSTEGSNAPRRALTPQLSALQELSPRQPSSPRQPHSPARSSSPVPSSPADSVSTTDELFDSMDDEQWARIQQSYATKLDYLQSKMNRDALTFLSPSAFAFMKMSAC